LLAKRFSPDLFSSSGRFGGKGVATQWVLAATFPIFNKPGVQSSAVLFGCLDTNRTRQVIAAVRRNPERLPAENLLP